MASRTRERRIIATVPCPACGAKIGERCRRKHQGERLNPLAGRIFVCADRRSAWQAVRDKEIP